MKFLVDRCAGHRLAAGLQGKGFDAIESRTLGPDLVQPKNLLPKRKQQ